MVEVAPEDVEPGRGPLEAVLLYCGNCGTVLGPYVAVGVQFTHGVARARSGLVPRDVAPARSRRFPDELLPPVDMAEVPEEARVELVYGDDDVIEGTAGGKKVRLAGRVGSHLRPSEGVLGRRSPQRQLAHRGQLPCA